MWWNVFRPHYPEVAAERTDVGQDIELLADFAVFVSANTIFSQKKVHDERFLNFGVREDVGMNLALRFATDDFLVGYAVGVADRHVRGNGRTVDEIPLSKLLNLLRIRLEEQFPNLDVETIYRRESTILACGLLLGLCEPGRNEDYSGLLQVWRSMSLHNPMADSGIELAEFASDCYGIGIVTGDYDLVREAGAEMFARYASMMK